MPTRARPKKHPSKDPRRIARDIAKAVCAPALELADIVCDESQEHEGQHRRVSFWLDDLLNAVRGRDESATEGPLYGQLVAKVPADLRELLGKYKQAADGEAIDAQQAGFLLGLEIGARQSTAILAEKRGRAGRAS